MSVNVANEYFKVCKRNTNEYLTLILDTKYNRKICNTLVNAYMESRYYNYGDGDTLKSMVTPYLKDSISEITDNKDIALFGKSVLEQMLFIDGFIDDLNLRNRINTINNLRIQKLGINEKGFVDKLFKIIKFNNNKRDKYFSHFKTPDFELKITKTRIKDLFNTSLDYNISFNTLYSEYAITNAFDTGMVKEDKMSVIYYLYIKTVMDNIIKGDMKKNYLLDFDSCLFSKEKKLGSTLNIIESDSVKDMTSLKITYTEFLSFKNNIYELKRDGFNFAVIIDGSYIDDDVNFTKLQLFKYVIIDKEEYKYDSIMKMNNVVLL